MIITNIIIINMIIINMIIINVIITNIAIERPVIVSEERLLPQSDGQAACSRPG